MIPQTPFPVKPCFLTATDFWARPTLPPLQVGFSVKTCSAVIHKTVLKKTMRLGRKKPERKKGKTLENNTFIWFITIGLIASVILILAGIVVLTGFFGKWGYSPSGWPEKIGSNFGYGVFGSDFYSYVVNNAAQAGFSANNAANNIYDVVMMLRFSIGLFMICFGLGSLGAFGMAFTGYMKNGKDALEVPTAPTTPEVNSFIAPNPGNIGTQAAPADNAASLT